MNEHWPTGSEAGRRCVSSNAVIGAEDRPRVSEARGGNTQSGLLTTAQEEGMGPSNPDGRLVHSVHKGGLERCQRMWISDQFVLMPLLITRSFVLAIIL